MTSSAFASVMLLAAAANSCNEGASGSNALRTLFRDYEQGSIDECRLNGSLVYTAGLNAHDAQTEIFDSTGKKIATCNYAFGQVDEACRQLQSCETIYRSRSHITGQPPVDKYGLSR